MTDVAEPTDQSTDAADPAGAVEAHSGAHAVAVAQSHGVETMFTLSGAHVFPMYDGAVKAEPPMRLLDVRHEQTAVFAAEAVGKLTRVPGLAVLTAGPGTVKSVYRIDLRRPRVMADIRYDPQFVEIARVIWNDLREEVQIGQSRALETGH